jgi:hypothetical protein
MVTSETDGRPVCIAQPSSAIIWEHNDKTATTSFSHSAKFIEQLTILQSANKLSTWHEVRASLPPLEVSVIVVYPESHASNLHAHILLVTLHILTCMCDYRRGLDC